MITKVHKEFLDVELGKRISEYLKQNADRPVLLLVSGGSALKVLDNIDEGSLGGNITVSLIDERLSEDPQASNFLQLTRTNLYRAGPRLGVKFIPIKQISTIYPVQTVVAIMGIGPDGHTAGVMPYPEDAGQFGELFENEKVVVTYDAGEKNQYPLRITTTIKFIREAIDQAFVYVSGEGKREILHKVLAANDEIHKYPARVIHSMRNVEVYTDIDK